MAKEQAKSDASMALLFIRLALGIVVFAHGAQKVLGWFGGPGFDKTIETFTGRVFESTNPASNKSCGVTSVPAAKVLKALKFTGLYCTLNKL